MTFSESNLRVASSPSVARTFQSRLHRALYPAALAKSPQTFTSTQRDVRTSCLAHPGPRRTASSTFLRASFALQGVAKRGCRFLRARSRPLLASHPRVQSQRSRAAHGRTPPPHHPHSPPCSLRPRPHLRRQRTPIWAPRSLTAHASLPRSRPSCCSRMRRTTLTTATRSHRISTHPSLP